MAFTKITPDELTGKGVIGQPAVPGLSVEEMQKSVEQIVREVAIPGVNRLVDELGEETAAGNIGMTVPSTMPPETGATVGEIVTEHIENKENPHGVTAAQVGAYTKDETDAAIDQKVQAIGAADMSKAEFAENGEYGVVDKAKSAETADMAETAYASDDGIKVYRCITSGTTHALAGTGNNIKFVADAEYKAGDTITVNRKVVTAQTQDGVALADGAWASGATVVCWMNGTTLTVGGGGNAYTPPKYSTTDWEPTGEMWIDGKPIYRKVLTGTILNGARPSELSDVDTIIKAYGWGKPGNSSGTKQTDTFYPLPSGYNSFNFMLLLDNDGPTFSMVYNSTSGSMVEAYITVEATLTEQ